MVGAIRQQAVGGMEQRFGGFFLRAFPDSGVPTGFIETPPSSSVQNRIGMKSLRSHAWICRACARLPHVRRIERRMCRRRQQFLPGIRKLRMTRIDGKPPCSSRPAPLPVSERSRYAGCRLSAPQFDLPQIEVQALFFLQADKRRHHIGAGEQIVCV